MDEGVKCASSLPVPELSRQNDHGSLNSASLQLSPSPPVCKNSRLATLTTSSTLTSRTKHPATANVKKKKAKHFLHSKVSVDDCLISDCKSNNSNSNIQKKKLKLRQHRQLYSKMSKCKSCTPSPASSSTSLSSSVDQSDSLPSKKAKSKKLPSKESSPCGGKSSASKSNNNNKKTFHLSSTIASKVSAGSKCSSDTNGKNDHHHHHHEHISSSTNVEVKYEEKIVNAKKEANGSSNKKVSAKQQKNNNNKKDLSHRKDQQTPQKSKQVTLTNSQGKNSSSNNSSHNNKRKTKDSTPSNGKDTCLSTTTKVPCNSGKSSSDYNEILVSTKGTTVTSKKSCTSWSPSSVGKVKDKKKNFASIRLSHLAKKKKNNSKNQITASGNSKGEATCSSLFKIDYEEDVIDGYSFLSFSDYDTLKVSLLFLLYFPLSAIALLPFANKTCFPLTFLLMRFHSMSGQEKERKKLCFPPSCGQALFSSKCCKVIVVMVVNELLVM